MGLTPEKQLIEFACKNDIECIIHVERSKDNIILKWVDGSITNIHADIITEVIQDNLIKASVTLRMSKVKPSFNIPESN